MLTGAQCGHNKHSLIIIIFPAHGAQTHDHAAPSHRMVPGRPWTLGLWAPVGIAPPAVALSEC
jgi:hypothetical protein